MEYIFALLFFVSLIAFPVVLIKPSLIFYRGNIGRKKAVAIVTGAAFTFFILTGITAPPSKTQSSVQQSVNDTNTKDQVKNSTVESTKKQPTLVITKEVIRIGDRNIISDSERGFDYEDYKISSLERIDKAINNYHSGQVIKVPFKDDIEVEIHFNALDLKGAGIFGGGSEFVVIPDDKEPTAGGRPTQGKIQSWKIENNRAIGHFPPWVSVPYGDGGVTKLILNLETKSGQKFSREWIFQVGKNPEVYDKEF